MGEKFSKLTNSGYLYANIDPPKAEITDLYIYPTNRRDGAGTALLHALGDHCRGAGVETIKAVMLPGDGIDKSQLRRFYRQNGFTKGKGKMGADTLFKKL